MKKRNNMCTYPARVSKLCLLSFFLLFRMGSSAQPIPVDDIYQTIKNNSVFRDSVNWIKVDHLFYEGMSEATSAEDTLQMFVVVFRIMGDVHSSIQYQGKNYNYYIGLDDSVYVRLKPDLAKMQEETGKIYAVMLDDQIAYLRIPAIYAFGAFGSEKGDVIAEALCTLLDQYAQAVIVDLRLNSGGNMYPMITGLSAILGNGILGSAHPGERASADFTWLLEDGKLYFQYPDTRILLDSLSAACFESAIYLPVAVLTGPLTASSGTATAIALHGRKNTLFIGEPTAKGYITGNSYYAFSPELTMMLSTHFNADRNGTIFTETIMPDLMVIGENNFDDLTNDSKIKQAIQWIEQQ
ncbi:MAG: S41 family peptidase [Chitinophagales bacterium]